MDRFYINMDLTKEMGKMECHMIDTAMSNEKGVKQG
jgi:hypothetical protein